jgi:zinc protease
MGKLPRPTRVLDQTYTVEPPQDGERFVTLRRVGEGQNLVIAYHAVAAAHPDAAAIQVLAGIMSGGGAGGRGGRGGRGGGGAEGRLAKALVDTKLAVSANMGFQQLHDPGLIQISATLNKDQSLDAARDAIFKVLEDVVKNPPTAQEVDRVRSQLLRGLANSLSDPQSIATGALNTSIAGRFAAAGSQALHRTSYATLLSLDTPLRIPIAGSTRLNRQPVPRDVR